MQDLGFQISWHKVVPPTQQLTFLGTELNSVTRCTALPQSKLVELQEVIKGFTTRIWASKRQLQQLAGKLSWACRVVYGGRTFLRHILDVIGSLSSSSARYKLSAGFYEDIQWSDTFLATFNGRQLFLQPVSAQVQTDACHQAAGAFFEGDWLYHNFACDSHHWLLFVSIIRRRLWCTLQQNGGPHSGQTSILLWPVTTKQQ